MSEFPYDAGNPGPCCQKIEDMLDYARPIIQRWPPFHKYTLGEEIYDIFDTFPVVHKTDVLEREYEDAGFVA